MTVTIVRLNEILTGTVAPIGPKAAPSGIDKYPREGRIRIGRTGLEGDQQADLKHHGGPDKAIHHYPFEHYSLWQQEIGLNHLLEKPGAFGENFTTKGLTEADVAIGDVFQAGSALIQVSQGRQPCWKLNARFDLKDLATRVQNNGRTGWYYRVLREGSVEAGAELQLVDRTNPEWTVSRIWKAFYVRTLEYGELSQIAQLPQLAESWRELASLRLKKRSVEDWTSRLAGGE